MILSRVIAHVKAQHWTAVVLDFVIVVAGVFIGIQLGNWNDARQEHAEQQQIELRLREGVHLLDEALTGALDEQEETILALNTLKTAIERGEAHGDEDEAVKLAVVRGAPPPTSSAAR